jgi:hypothetical protein
MERDGRNERRDRLQEPARPAASTLIVRLEGFSPSAVLAFAQFIIAQANVNRQAVVMVVGGLGRLRSPPSHTDEPRSIYSRRYSAPAERPGNHSHCSVTYEQRAKLSLPVVAIGPHNTGKPHGPALVSDSLVTPAALCAVNNSLCTAPDFCQRCRSDHRRSAR